MKRTRKTQWEHEHLRQALWSCGTLHRIGKVVFSKIVSGGHNF